VSEINVRAIRQGPDAGVPSLDSHAEGAKPMLQGFLDHYGLFEQPFGVTPDPRFMYLGPRHREALTALKFGTETRRGFMAMIAKPGMGKTSLLFSYLEGLRGKARTVFLFRTSSDPIDLMRQVLNDLGLETGGKDLLEMHAILNRVLMEELRRDRPFVFVLDEAQELEEKLLEFVRLLSNFETPWTKLIQIVLAGQPGLASRLAQPSLAQLRQRISFFIPIEPFTREQVSAYVDHRLWVAGYKGQDVFTLGSRRLIAESSEGIPRTINNLCFYAMSYGWALKRRTITEDMIREVLNDFDLDLLEGEARRVLKPRRYQPSGDSQTVAAKSNVSTWRRWWPKVALTGAVLLALGWSTDRMNNGVVRNLLSRVPALIGRSLVAPPRPRPNPGPPKPAAPSVHYAELNSDTAPTDDTPEVSGGLESRSPTGGITVGPSGSLNPQ
jgi:general secretion pathway protein A